MQPITDPTTLGFSAERLARLDKYLAGYVDDGRLAGWQLALTRRDQLAHFSSYGARDKEAGLPAEPDTIWRIASMTKPITTVTAMTLWQQGVFSLQDPISKWIPSFENVRVYDKGTPAALFTVPAIEPIRVWHLMSHTSGLTAGFMQSSVVDALYRQAGYEWGAPPKESIAQCVEDWAALPLLFQPGSAWGYGVSTDVLGRLIEIWTGESLDEAFASRVLGPLGMTDTAFYADDTRIDRLAALYVRNPENGQALRQDWGPPGPQKLPAVLSGGGGLISTTSDYVRFTRMLARGGELDL